MFELTDDVRSQLKKTTIADARLTAAENLVFLVIGRWDVTVLLGSLLGLATCFAFFLSICLSVPKALRLGDEDMAKKYIASGRNIRMLIVIVGVVLALKVSVFNPVAAIIPILFFNRLSITILNLKGEN